MLNHIALSKAKIAYNFGLSECNRVKIWVTGKCATSVRWVGMPLASLPGPKVIKLFYVQLN